MWDGIQGQTFKQLLHPACGVVQRFDVIRYYCKLWVVFCFIHFEPMRSMVFLCNPFSKSDVLVQTITIDSFVGDWCSTVQHSLILTTRQLAECQLAIVGEVKTLFPSAIQPTPALQLGNSANPINLGEQEHEQEDEDPYASKSVAQLKAELRTRKLSVAGVRKDLLQRLHQDDETKKGDNTVNLVDEQEDEQEDEQKDEDPYASKSVAQLKAELRTRKLSVAGVRKELLQRLHQDDGTTARSGVCVMTVVVSGINQL
jgi:hypothetical protein